MTVLLDSPRLGLGVQSAVGVIGTLGLERSEISVRFNVVSIHGVKPFHPGFLPLIREIPSHKAYPMSAQIGISKKTFCLIASVQIGPASSSPGLKRLLSRMGKARRP